MAAKKKTKRTILLTYFLLSFISIMFILIFSFLSKIEGNSSSVTDRKSVETGKISTSIKIENKDSSKNNIDKPVPKPKPSENIKPQPKKSEPKRIVRKPTVKKVPQNPTKPKVEKPKKSPVISNTEVAPSVEKPIVSSGKTNNFKKVKKGTALFIVLDDVGNDLVALSHFTSLPIKITYAIMPKRRFSGEAARRIHAVGGEVIVHQPMEPLGSSDPGAGALFTWMTKDDIVKELESCIMTVPYAVGMNNHMGSKATGNFAVMSAVLEYLQEQNMFFLDSKTTANVAGAAIAFENGWKYTQRNAMFLDNEKDRESIETAIKSGMKVAEKKGHAVMIGHVMTTELAEVLLKMYPDILDAGYEFDHLSEYFTGEFSE